MSTLSGCHLWLDSEHSERTKTGKSLNGGIDNSGYHAFFEALIEGRLRLGQTLKQEELGAILGLSLSPMRETTTLLEAEGMITVRRKVGITIFYPDMNFVGNTLPVPRAAGEGRAAQVRHHPAARLDRADAAEP